MEFARAAVELVRAAVEFASSAVELARAAVEWVGSIWRDCRRCRDNAPRCPRSHAGPERA